MQIVCGKCEYYASAQCPRRILPGPDPSPVSAVCAKFTDDILDRSVMDNSEV